MPHPRTLLPNLLPTHTYATITPTSRFTRTRKPVLDLNHFLQRQRVLALYRSIIRATYKIPASSMRNEMKSFAREEFERNKDVQDLGHIRYLVSTGKEEFERVRRYVDEGVGQ